MKEKLKNRGLALSSAMAELCGSVVGYSGGMMILSGSFALIKMLASRLKGQKMRFFLHKNRDIYIK